MWARTLLVLVACIRSRRGWPHRVDLGLAQSVEDLPVEQLIAKAGVEALDVAVLPRAASLDVSGLGADNREARPSRIQWPASSSNGNGSFCAVTATALEARATPLLLPPIRVGRASQCSAAVPRRCAARWHPLPDVRICDGEISWRPPSPAFSFDRLVGEREQPVRNLGAVRLRGLEVHH